MPTTEVIPSETVGLSPDRLAMLDASDVGALYLPQHLGGQGLDPMAFSAVIQDLARRDASAGWVAMVWGTYSAFSGFLSDDVTAQVWKPVAGRSPRLSGTITPVGTARRVADGYLVSGRWPFGSGGHHADWMIGNCLVIDDDGPVIGPAGGTEARIVVVPVDNVELHSTWDVAGLEATASDDYSMADVFVPDSFTLPAFTAPPLREGALFRCPFITVFAAGVAAPLLGMAGRALDELAELAGSKTPAGSAGLLRDRQSMQYEFGRAEASLRAARALLVDALERLWGQLINENEVTLDDRAAVRLATAHAGATATSVAETAYRLGGATSNFRSSPLSTCLADTYAASRHIAVNEQNFELAGRVLLGLDPGTPRF